MLRGENILLREITEKDSDLVVRWRNAELPAKVFFSADVLTREKQDEWIARYRDDHGDLTFIIECEGKPVGMIALYHIEGDTAEFGRLLIGEKASRRRGLAKEAMKVILRHGFEHMGLKHIVAKLFADNMAAFNLYSSTGFRTAGTEDSPGGRKILTMVIDRQAGAGLRGIDG